jgi:prepilin signal peptidase PulO-like enzyme (type II secretory pathway)
MAVLWGPILWGELRIINPIYPLIIILLGVVFGYLHWARRLHGWALNGVFFLLISLTLYYRLLTLTGVFLCLYALFALGGIVFGKNIYRPPAWVPAMSLANLFVALFLFHFRFVTGEHLDRVSTHPAVERLFVYDNSDPVGRMIGKNIMIVQEACDPNKYLVGSHHGGAGLVLVDRKKNSAYANPHILECSNDVLVDCATQEATVGDYGKRSGLFFFDLNNWPKQSKPMIPIPGEVVYIVFDKVIGIYLVFPHKPVLLAADSSTGELLGSLPGPDEGAYDSSSREFTVLTEPDFSIMRLEIGDRKDSPFEVRLRRSMGVPVYKRLQMYFHPGPTDGTTLVTSLWEGTVTLYDQDLRPARRKRIVAGTSGMALTPDKRHLLIGGYADGRLYFMDMETWDVVASLYLGHRMRELRLSKDGRYVYVGTSQGGFRVDIPRVMGERQS